MTNRLLNLLLILFLVIIQVSFLTTWPMPVSSLNLILSAVIFIAVIIDYHLGLFWAFSAGFLLELYSGLSFGITTASLILTVIIINFLFTNFFTNRSLYSLVILGCVGTLGYNLLILIFNFLSIVLGLGSGLNDFSFWSFFFWEPLFNFLILIIIFFAFYLSTGKLHNIFLFPTQDYENEGKY